MTRSALADPVRGRLPVAARDRRPAMAALALLLVLSGGLGAALVVYRAGQKTDVLVAAHDITPGHKVDRSDFSLARVSTDASGVIAASSMGQFVGTYSRSLIPSGTLLNAHMFAVKVMPGGSVVVGVTLGAGRRPAAPIQAGQVVRAFLVPASNQAAAGNPGQVLASAALVVDVAEGSAQDTVTLSLLVAPDAAAAIVPAAVQGQIAVAVLPAGTRPTIDLSGS